MKNGGNIVKKISVKQVFAKNNLAVVFASDKNYVPYMAVALQSIFSNADANYNYDILILDDGITDYQKELLAQYATKNFSVRYVDVKPLMQDMDASLFKARGIWSKAALYRLFIPQIMGEYDKVLYLDCDVLVKDPLVELFATDMKDKPAACVYDEIRYTGSSNRIRDINRYLGIKDYKQYFNSGVVLFNLKNIDGKKFTADFVHELQRPYLPFLDQDVLNILWEDKFLPLEGKWNYQYYTMIEHPDLKDNEELAEAKQNRKIIHYITQYKPWNSPELPLAYEWWSEARKTPFYEEIIYKNTKMSNLLLKNLLKYNRLFGKYVIYKIGKNITFGKMRRKIEQQLAQVKKQVKQVRAVYKGK